MSRLSKLSLLSVVLVSVLILGVLGGVAIAQSGVWQRPGDDVATIHDADAALAYWNDIQRDTDPAHEQLWSAFGEMVDNLMELDIRTRNMAGVPTPQVAAAADGTNGTNGEDGSSCSVSINGAEDEVTISCTDGSSVSYPVTPPRRRDYHPSWLLPTSTTTASTDSRNATR